MATIPAATSPQYPTHEERQHAAEQFQAALRESESLQRQIADLAARIREEAGHVGE